MPTKAKLPSSSSSNDKRNVLKLRPPDSVNVFRPQSTANVVMSLFPLWAHDIRGVLLPSGLLFERVCLDKKLIQRWIDSDYEHLGGLLYPRGPFEMELQTPFVQILKNGVVCRKTGNSAANLPRAVYDECEGRLHVRPAPLEDQYTEEEAKDDHDTCPRPVIRNPNNSPLIKVDLTVFVFRRDLDPSPALNPYNPATWNPVSYVIWLNLHAQFAPTMHQECVALNDPSLPSDACTLFRRVMRTHFDDCGLLFNRIWWTFGLGAMVDDRISLRSFMRGMLTDMFMAYHMLPSPPAVSTLFNPRTYDPGQRMCAHCLTLMQGQHRMMRCPCGQVYYCNDQCQKKHWKAHKAVCGKRVL